VHPAARPLRSTHTPCPPKSIDSPYRRCVCRSIEPAMDPSVRHHRHRESPQGRASAPRIELEKSRRPRSRTTPLRFHQPNARARPNSWGAAGGHDAFLPGPICGAVEGRPPFPVDFTSFARPLIQSAHCVGRFEGRTPPMGPPSPPPGGGRAAGARSGGRIKSSGRLATCGSGVVPFAVGNLSLFAGSIRRPPHGRPRAPHATPRPTPPPPPHDAPIPTLSPRSRPIARPSDRNDRT